MIGWLLAAVGMYMLMAKWIRPWIYDVMIVDMTRVWYQTVINLLDRNVHLLDVGIGTGTALLLNKSVLKAKNIKVTGIDYDKDYVELCDKNIKKESMSKNVGVSLMSVYDYNPDHKFDAAYFSGSLMIMPDPVGALKQVKKMLKDNGLIYITQTIETNKSPMLELTKPLLKFITTIDFGNVTYQNDFESSIQQAGLKIKRCISLGTSKMTTSRSFKLFVVQ
ncbi:cobalt-precorrin-6B C(15)-methyltransferase [Acrasis kona]|uniref:phosphoethanolamine N-methyltransferase n=1 Tax=Acrasis kona TaxID=1008807 RepID=A0AAW2YM16_9EUKA